MTTEIPTTCGGCRHIAGVRATGDAYCKHNDAGPVLRVRVNTIPTTVERCPLRYLFDETSLPDLRATAMDEIVQWHLGNQPGPKAAPITKLAMGVAHLLDERAALQAQLRQQEPAARLARTLAADLGGFVVEPDGAISNGVADGILRTVRHFGAVAAGAHEALDAAKALVESLTRVTDAPAALGATTPAKPAINMSIAGEPAPCECGAAAKPGSAFCSSACREASAEST